MQPEKSHPRSYIPSDVVNSAGAVARTPLCTAMIRVLHGGE